jgi:hypothetical protein
MLAVITPLLKIEDATTPKQISIWNYRVWGVFLKFQKNYLLRKKALKLT